MICAIERWDYEFREFIKQFLSEEEYKEVNFAIRKEILITIDKLQKNDFQVTLKEVTDDNNSWKSNFIESCYSDKMYIWYNNIIIGFLVPYQHESLDYIDKEFFINKLDYNGFNINKILEIWEEYSLIIKDHLKRINYIKDNVRQYVINNIVKNPVYLPSINKRNKKIFIGKLGIRVWIDNKKINDYYPFMYMYNDFNEGMHYITRELNLYYRIYKYNNKDIVLFRSLKDHSVKVISILE